MVCHDLGKTYPEVRKLHPGEVLFHFHHAIRRKNEKTEELNQILEFFMKIVNPEMYNEYIKIKDSSDIQVSSYKENMEDSDFMDMIRKAETRFKPNNKAPKPEEAVKTLIEEKQPPTPPVNPLKWGRPKDLSALVINKESKSPEETDFNPVRWD